jgi:hypothetical protein
MVEAEHFKATWRGWIRSSEGYAVRLLGRTGLTYRDDLGEIRIDAEAMSKPWNEIVVHARSIPDRPERSKSEVLDRLGRAFAFRGWRLRLEDENSA